MLKLFRRYSKWMLVIFGALLMVVFLVEGTVSSIMPQPEDQVIGRIDGQKVRLRDQTQANKDMEIISHVMPPLTLLAPSDPMQWLLMIKGAEQAGLGVSNSQVVTLLGLYSNTGVADLDQIAKSANATTNELIRALKHWLLIQEYVELNSGLSHLTLDEKMQTLQQGLMYMQMGLNNPQMVIDPARGNPRISGPLMERFLQDQQATVTMQAIAIGPERTIALMDKPQEAQVQKLYDEYKDRLPGGSEGYGLGYKLPDRVKLEYLTIPFEEVLKQTRVPETQVVAYYDQHQEDYKTQPALDDQGKPVTAATVRPYLEVRKSIVDQLTQQAAYQTATRIANAAQAALIENARSLPEADGYRVIEPTWKPTSLIDLSKDLEKRFNVILEVRQITDHWLTLSEVQALNVLGTSSIPLGGSQNLPATAYIAGVRELEPAETNPAASLRLQAMMPSQPVIGQDGSVTIFRVTAAQKSHIPALADIHAQVELDVQRVEAYKANLAKMDQWKSKLGEPLIAVAKELNTSILGPTSFNRRDTFGGVSQVPSIPGIGRSQTFVDKVFDLALESHSARKTPATGEAASTEDEPATVIAVDDKLTIYLVRVVDFKPMTKRDYEQQVSLSFNRVWVNLAMLNGLESQVFSVNNLAKRIGFVWENPRDEEKARSAASQEEDHSTHNH